MWEKTKLQERNVFIIIELLWLMHTHKFENVELEGHLSKGDRPLRGGDRGNVRQKTVILKKVL